MMSRSWWMRMVLLLALCFAAPLLAQEEAKEPDLRVGVLLAETLLPIYIAQDAGYFAEEGVVIELVLYPSAQAARSAALAGEVDAFSAGIFSGMWLNDNGADVRVVRHRQLKEASFALVAGPQSGLESVADLAGARIGLATNTLVQYTTDQMLASVGMSAAEVEYVAAANILERFQMLIKREIDAATLPFPYIAIASEFFGAPILIDDTGLPGTLAILVQADVLAEKGDAVRAFLRGYERAVKASNADPQLFREVLKENVLVPPSFLMIPAASAFETAGVPSEEEVADAVEWALAIGLIGEAQAYEEVVDGSFLPEMMGE
ncbi:MAG: ABC transporter substrate-binding protein [Anaerolineaceae bacterium]|nr:ABC transporter substrate-binding protein [Anaerolineaceae bacterium]